RCPTVLVVEDDEPTRLGLAATLAGAGYLVLTAATSRDALQTLQTPLAPVGVVVLDLGLPDMDGVSLWRRVPQLHPHLPVIVCTGRARPEEAAQLVELGMRHFLLKPVNLEELLAAVKASLP